MFQIFFIHSLWWFFIGFFCIFYALSRALWNLKQANATCCRCLRIVVRHFPARFGGHSFKAVVLPFCYFINQATYKRSFLRGSNMQYQCRRHISLFWIMLPTTKLAAISKRDEQVNSMWIFLVPFKKFRKNWKISFLHFL